MPWRTGWMPVKAFPAPRAALYNKGEVGENPAPLTQ